MVLGPSAPATFPAADAVLRRQAKVRAGRKARLRAVVVLPPAAVGVNAARAAVAVVVDVRVVDPASRVVAEAAVAARPSKVAAVVVAARAAVAVPAVVVAVAATGTGNHEACPALARGAF